MSEPTSESAMKSNGSVPHPEPGKRRVFSDEQIRSAVLKIRGGASVAAVAEEMQAHPSILRRWIKAKLPRARASSAQEEGVRTTATGRRFYSPAFKRAAVARLKKGEGISEIVSDLKIHNSMLYAWRDVIEGQRTSKAERPVKAVDNVQHAGAASAGKALPIPVRDAISFLKHAKTAMSDMLRRGEIKDFDEAHDLSRMALRELLKLGQ